MTSAPRFRTLSGPLYYAQYLLEVVLPIVGIFFVLNVPLYISGISLLNQQYLGLFLGMVMALAFLVMPGSQKSPRDRVPWYDVVFAGLSFIIGVWILFSYPHLILTIGVVTPFRLGVGVAMLALVLEGTRRVTGWPLAVILVVGLLYFRYGYLLPGALTSPKVDWGSAIVPLFLGSNALYGIALRIAALIVLAFVIFANVLFGTGAGDFFFQAANAVMGRYRGGPAKASIGASAFFGMLSGSAVANVAGTGTITIPLMKRTGYPAYYASAVEAVASTGGCMTPPVMGAAAFIIAEFLAIAYSQVVLIAIMPALLYYLSLFIQVDLKAAKEGLVGIPRDEIPALGKTLWAGKLYVLPVVVLIYSLFVLHLRPEIASLYAVAVLLVTAVFSPAKRMNLGQFVRVMRNISRGMMEISVVTAAAGLVIGVVTYTGLGFSLSRIMTELAGNNLVILLAVTAVVSVILGMGVPVTASYILLAVLVAPSLVKVGVAPLVAHMFIFYFGTLSFITPPVCLAVYTAAAIGEVKPARVIVEALKLAAVGYIIPFIFVFNPAVVLIGEPVAIIIGVATAVIAVVSLSFSLEKYSFMPLTFAKQMLYVLASIGLLLPGHMYLRLAAVILFVGLIATDIVAVVAVRRATA